MYLSVKSKKLILERLKKFHKSLPWKHIKPGVHTLGVNGLSNMPYDKDNATELTTWISLLETDSPNISKVNWLQVMHDTNDLHRQIQKDMM